jgi:hypothetical protein
MFFIASRIISFVTKFMKFIMLLTGDTPTVLPCRDPRCCGTLHGVICYLVAHVSEQPRWGRYVTTKRLQPRTTITLSNIPELRRPQLSLRGNVKSHTTPYRLVDKVIRIIVFLCSAVAGGTLTFAVIYLQSRQLLMVWHEWNVGGYGAFFFFCGAGGIPPSALQPSKAYCA